MFYAKSVSPLDVILARHVSDCCSFTNRWSTCCRPASRCATYQRGLSEPCVLKCEHNL